MQTELSGSHVLFSILATATFVVTSILMYRYYLAHLTKRQLENSIDPRRPVSTRNKYPAADVFRHSGMVLRFGLTAGSFLCLVAFSYTKPVERSSIDVSEYDLDVEETEVVRTPYMPPAAPPPPPPPPVIEPVPDDEVVEDIKFEDVNVEAPAPPPPALAAGPKNVALPPAPPPPPAPEPKVVEIFKIVEQMPMFPGCDLDGLDKEELKKCSEKKMLEFIYGKVKYPALARENGIEGKAIVSFVIEKDGSITATEVIRGPGAGIDEEALRVVESFPKWIPGKQRGQPVRVSFVLPVQFKLTN